MTPIKDTDYLAVSAWLHAMETRLLTPEKVERLLEAASETEARKLLTECGYAEALPLEEALREHRETLYKELAAAVPDPRLIELFQLKYDYHNIKAILKAERRGISPEAFLLPGGRYDAAQLQSEWQQEHMFQVSDTARRAAQEAAALLRENDPQGADLRLDAACYDEMRTLAEEMKSNFLQGYVRQLIDAANLRTAVRASRSGSSEVLPRALLEGGSVSPHGIMMTEPGKLVRGRWKRRQLWAPRQRGAVRLPPLKKPVTKQPMLIWRQPAVPPSGRKQCCATWLLWKMRLQRFAL